MFRVLKDGTSPTRGSKYSACVDLYSSADVTIGAGDTKLVGLGVAIDDRKIRDMVWDIKACTPEELMREIHKFKKSHYLQLMLRSSLGKKGLILPNGVGVIDLDYEDEIKMIVHNPISEQNVFNISADLIHTLIERLGYGYRLKFKEENLNYEIKKGDRIAQITLIEHKSYLFGIESDVERDGGFGSTDEKN